MTYTQDGGAGTASSSIVEISTVVIYAPLFQLNWQSTDRIGLTAQTASSTTLTATSFAKGAADSSSSSSSSHPKTLPLGASLGIGLGVSVGLFQITLLCTFCIWRWRRKRREGAGVESINGSAASMRAEARAEQHEQQKPPSRNAASQDGGECSNTEEPSAPSGPARSEMPASPKGPNEPRAGGAGPDGLGRSDIKPGPYYLRFRPAAEGSTDTLWTSDAVGAVYFEMSAVDSERSYSVL